MILRYSQSYHHLTLTWSLYVFSTVVLTTDYVVSCAAQNINFNLIVAEACFVLINHNHIFLFPLSGHNRMWENVTNDVQSAKNSSPFASSVAIYQIFIPPKFPTYSIADWLEVKCINYIIMMAFHTLYRYQVERWTKARANSGQNGTKRPNRYECIFCFFTFCEPCVAYKVKINCCIFLDSPLSCVKKCLPFTEWAT